MRKLTVKPSAAKLATSAKAAKIVAPVAKPVAGPINTAPLGTVAADQAKRSNVAPTAKPAAVATPSEPTVAKPSGNVVRTVRTIAARATNFGGLSERDESYFSFYKTFGNSVTVGQIHASGKRPAYTGSNKPHDAGVIVRLVKAGLYTEAGGTLVLTDAGRAHRVTATA